MKKELYTSVLILIFILHGFNVPAQDMNSRPFSDPDSLNLVWANVMDDGAWCRVSWNWNTYFWEINYDDSEADDFFVFTNPGSMNAVRFTPTGSPTRVVGGQIYVGDGSFPGPFLGTAFRVIVFDDDGTGGFPGSALDSVTVTVNNYYWVEFEGLDAIIPSGDFYLAMRQLAPSPNAAPVGVDTDNPTYFRSYSKYLDNEWQLSPLQDFMMRAWISSVEEDSSNYLVHRFSNFDPNGSPLLGDTIALDTTELHNYSDYSWDSLAEGWYAYGVKEQYAGGGTSEYVISNIVGHFDTIPGGTPSCFYQADTGSMPLVICPPLDSNGFVPFNFVGYNLYMAGEFIEFIEPADTTIYELTGIYYPGQFTASVTAVYDLTPFGFPGEYGESLEAMTDCLIRYGYPLDFLEDWSSGSFETNNWIADGPNWHVNGTSGNIPPSAGFSFEPIQIDYDFSLESYPLLADSLLTGPIYLDFDIKLDAYNWSGLEKMIVEVWNWENQVWNPVDSLSNEEGGFDWKPVHLDITGYALSQVFKVRFHATGINTLAIVSWFIDNIHVYRECDAPDNLSVNGVYYNSILVEWDPIVTETWLHYDDGGNYTSVGTVGMIEFDAAVRWTPEQLQAFNGALLTKVAFFPVQSVATYNIRVWTGAGAENLVVDQPVENPVFDEWNFIELETPVPVDISQELWVGYHVYSTWGYPAGCDDGPAVDGYGNMIKYGSWKTLLEMNPDLDYNWNIQAYITEMSTDTINYAVYRSDDSEPYFLRAIVDQNFYVDDSVCGMPPFYHSYKVTALHINNNDTCESGYSNEGSEICEGVHENTADLILNIYPNPAGDLLHVEIRDDISFKKSEGDVISIAKLLNSNGQVIWENEINACSFILPVVDYPEGVYLLRVETDKGVVSKKVVVMR